MYVEEKNIFVAILDTKPPKMVTVTQDVCPFRKEDGFWEAKAMIYLMQLLGHELDKKQDWIPKVPPMPPKA